MSAACESRAGRSWLAFAVVPALAFTFQLATARGYGIFRDELYYLACGQRLAWGYVDHPPLIAWVTAAARATLGESLFALRALPALMVGVSAMCAAGTARALGGGGWAQTLASVTTALAPLALALGSFLSMNAFDLALWSAGWWLLARLLSGADPRLWCLYGLLAGVALLAKVSILFQGGGVLLALLAGRRRDVLASPWPWVGLALALLVFAPHLAWQAKNDWPTLEFMRNARAEKMLALSPGAFLGEVWLESNPFALPVLVGGIVWLVAFAPRALRALGLAWCVILLALIATGGKPYYFGPALPLAFAAGGVALERASVGRFGHPVRGACLALVFAGAALAAPLAKPLLPLETFIRYQAWLGIEPSVGERHERGRLPQFFADMQGWRELAECVAGVFRSLPPLERARARVFGQNYGEAGAIDFFGPEFGLPRALSGHNSYSLWGPGDWDGSVLIVIGDERERLEQLFEAVEAGARFDCSNCMPYEDGLTIWIARGLKGSVAELWSKVRRFV